MAGLFLLSAIIPAFGSGTLFFDDFSGPQLNPLWTTNLPNAPVANGYANETYLGAPNYQFQTISNVSTLQLSNSLTDLERVGWSLNTNFPSEDFRYEVRFNTLKQSPTNSIDAFVEVWILNSTNFSQYDIVSLFGGNYGTEPEFDAASSITGIASRQGTAYQDNTFYRLVLQGGPNENIRVSLCDDQGNELNGYDLGHTTQAYPAGFTIGLSQAMFAPHAPSPSDVAIASAEVTTTNIPVPHGATGTATVVSGFLVGVNMTDVGYGYTNTPLVRIIGGGGSSAQAVAVVSNGVVVAVNVLNAGYGYTNSPQVVIDPPFIPNPVLGIASMSLLSFSNLTVGVNYQLQRLQQWYWTNQSAAFTASSSNYTQLFEKAVTPEDYRLVLSPAPSQAFATAQIINGFLVGANITASGSGYVSSPTVSIIGGGGTNGAAIALISGGVVTNIAITSAGIGYTGTPVLQIEPPPAAALTPAVFPVMRVDSSNLAPYENYQIQFVPAIDATWEGWNGGFFTATATTNSQFLLITNDAGYFRLRYVHVP